MEKMVGLASAIVSNCVIASVAKQSRAVYASTGLPRRLRLLAMTKNLNALKITHPSARFRRSEEHTSELQSLMRISYAVFCLKKKINNKYEPPYLVQYLLHTSLWGSKQQ